jgi:hypothetical protein
MAELSSLSDSVSLKSLGAARSLRIQSEAAGREWERFAWARVALSHAGPCSGGDAMVGRRNCAGDRRAKLPGADE